MRSEDRALLQERVKTLVLGHALNVALSRLVEAEEAAGRDPEATLSTLEQSLLGTARGLVDRSATQKLTVLIAVEDVSATLKSAFEGARAQCDRARQAEGSAAIAA